MLENLSGITQLILLVVGLVLLFWAVMANHKRNKQKRQKRREKDFGKKLNERRKERKKESQE